MLLGPNGAGKTTTIRLLLGLQRPTAGVAEVFGQSVGVNATNVRRMIGFLPTNPSFPGHLRPVEYLDLLGKLCRLPREVRQPRLTSLLRAVGLTGATEQRIGTFSTGMCTRLGIAASRCCCRCGCSIDAICESRAFRFLLYCCHWFPIEKPFQEHPRWFADVGTRCC